MPILIFLVISVSLCVIRNGPKMIADMSSWKDRVRESSLRAFPHKGEFEVALHPVPIQLRSCKARAQDGIQAHHP